MRDLYRFNETSGRVRERKRRHPAGPIVPSIGTTTVIIVGDTHYGIENALNGNPNERQVAAINSISSKAHPLGGGVGKIDAVIQIGDAVHEDTETTDRFFDDYRLDGTGDIKYPCYVLDGNHDRAPTRTAITNTYGSLTWGVRIGRVWFQAMTENYTDESTNSPPSAAMIEGDVTDSMVANNSNGQPTFLMVHRALSGSYPAEWDRTAGTTITEDLDSTETGVDVASVAGLSIGQYIQVDSEDMLITNIVSLTLTVTRGENNATHTNGASVYATTALDSLKTLADSYRTWGIVHGHDHYSSHNTWRGYKAINPGSVMQAKAAQVGGETDPADFTTVFPESFVVMRIYPAHYDIASYVFGYGMENNELYWRPDTWEWAETVTP